MWYKDRPRNQTQEPAKALPEPSVEKTDVGYAVGINGEDTVLKVFVHGGVTATLTMNEQATKRLIKLLKATLSDSEIDQ
jgi:hypothetical protein